MEKYLGILLVMVFVIGMLFVFQTFKHSNSTDSLIMRSTPIFICFLLIVVFILGMIITAQNRRINDLQKVVDVVPEHVGEINSFEKLDNIIEYEQEK